MTSIPDFSGVENPAAGQLLAVEYFSSHVVGIDEAGRGPLAGPVTAAAVILDPENPIKGLDDSKKLSEKKRELLYPLVKESALAWCVAWASPAEIDEINILQATFMAMKRAVEGLEQDFSHLLVDGNHRIPHFEFSLQTPVVKGDGRVACVAAASILAKVDRDREMLRIHEKYPEYGFDRHKGYPGKAHVEAIRKNGYCPEHRRSFHVKALAQYELDLSD